MKVIIREYDNYNNHFPDLFCAFLWIETRRSTRDVVLNNCNVSTFVRIIDLDVIVAVQDQPPSKQDINKSSFNVVTVTRTYELMAHDEDEKLKYCHLK